MTCQVGENVVQTFLMRIDVNKFAVVNFPALVNHDHSIGHRFDFLQNMSRQQNRFLLPQPTNRLPDTSNLVRIEPRGWFIQNQHIRFVDQSLSHSNALSITFGKLVDRFVNHASQRAQINHFGDLIKLGAFVHSSRFGEKSQQAIRRHLWIERPRFRQVAKPMRTRQAFTVHVVAGNPSDSLAGRKVARQDFHRRALTGSVGPQKRNDFSLVNLEADVPSRRKNSVELRKPIRLNHGRFVRSIDFPVGIG